MTSQIPSKITCHPRTFWDSMESPVFLRVPLLGGRKNAVKNVGGVVVVAAAVVVAASAAAIVIYIAVVVPDAAIFLFSGLSVSTTS